MFVTEIRTYYKFAHVDGVAFPFMFMFTGIDQLSGRAGSEVPSYLGTGHRILAAGVRGLDET